MTDRPEFDKVAERRPIGWIDESGNLFPIAAYQPPYNDKHKAAWRPVYDFTAAEVVLLNEWLARTADSHEPTSGESYLRKLADYWRERALDAEGVLRMVDTNQRIDEGEKRKAWSGRFVIDEVRRVVAKAPTTEDGEP